MYKIHFIIFLIVIIVLVAISIISLVFLTKPFVLIEENNYIPLDEPKKVPCKKKIRILIDPGHTADTIGARGILGFEYRMTYKISSILCEKLSEDEIFEYSLSRDGDYYSKSIKDYIKDNYDELSNILNAKVKSERREGKLTREQTMELYAIRKYAIENNFDLLLSLHFDYTTNIKRRNDTKGFQVIVSPYNKEFPASMQIAGKIADGLKEIYPVSSTIGFDNNLPKSVWLFYSQNGLRIRGVSLRSLVVLGDIFEYFYYESQNAKTEDIPSVLVEIGYMHDKSFLKSDALEKVSDKIYESLVNVYKKR